MKVKAHIQVRQYKVAHLAVNDADFLAYVNSHPSPEYASLDELRESGDFDWWLREYLEETVFRQGAVLINIGLEPAGETEYYIDDTEVLE